MLFVGRVIESHGDEDEEDEEWPDDLHQQLKLERNTNRKRLHRVKSFLTGRRGNRQHHYIINNASGGVFID